VPLTVERGEPVASPPVTCLRSFGFHERPTPLVLPLGSAVEPMSPQDPKHEMLRPLGWRGHFGKRISISSVA
jgi:hypothetical protein